MEDIQSVEKLIKSPDSIKNGRSTSEKREQSKLAHDNLLVTLI